MSTKKRAGKNSPARQKKPEAFLNNGNAMKGTGFDPGH